ncbi:MAG: sodium-dependent transporter [Candidatus Accumulibacter sp.]|jgi:NSS family neurotransmitter:Na+ symporter|nr:sodium-dependent transporter [Accumulibacter sp.]
MVKNHTRENLGSRIGFLLISAGCAVGLGNVWRFPFIVGMYGGAAFVLVYLFFLLFFALPIMVMEFSVGRASRMNVAGSFGKLQPAGAKWHYFGIIGLLGNYLLMMFYTTVSGWMLSYVWHFIDGSLSGLGPDGVSAFFGDFLGNPYAQAGWMALCVLLGFIVCGIGLKRGVERVSIIMMSGLFLILIALALRSLSLPGAKEGLAFYLLPDFGRMMEKGLWTSIYAAMGQSFFTLSIGIGSMAIFGSYIGRDRSLTGESVNIMLLDTTVAIVAGLIIFPACFTFGVDAGAGPGLIFVTLPNVFNEMTGGRFWGTLFFLFMSFAALSTVIAVFENLVSYGIDVRGWSRKKSARVNFFVMLVASLPCALGFNVLSGIQPLGAGSGILDLEDFIVSNNLLPIGALIYLLFCTSRYGWGWDNFIAEADTGAGLKFPKILRTYISYVLPVIILAVLVQGYIDKF